MLRRKVLRLATALGFVISSVAVAQDATTPPPAAPPPAAPPAAAPQSAVVGDQPAAAPAPKSDEERTEEIVVTGTRIKRKDLTTPAPVTVINRDQIAASGKVSIGDFLQSLPEQGNAINTGVNNGGDGSTRINLRGLGVNRTLVLVNGRRWVPGGTGADGSVDLNSIPAAAVERIEVLKDGASAVYGSDAIAGVVNIITRRTGDKTDASVYTGVSGHGDGTTFDLALTTGTGNERSNILLSAGYFKQQKVMAGDRNFSKFAWGYDMPLGSKGAPYSSGSASGPEGITFGDDTVTGSTVWNSLNTAYPGGDIFIWTPGPASGTTFCGPTAAGPNQCFRQWAGSGLPAAGDVTTGDGYNFAKENYLVTPQQRIQLFGTGDLKLGSVARGYFEASYVNRQSGQDLAPEPLNLDQEGLVVTADNVYNPMGTDVEVRRRMTEFGRRQQREEIDTFRLVGGIDGTLPDAAGPFGGWFWDVNANWGRTVGNFVKRGNLYIPNLEAALGPSFMNADGKAQCGTAAAPIPLVGEGACVPLNMFGGPGAVTPDQVAGLTFTGTSRGTNVLSSVAANTSGELPLKLLSEKGIGLAIGAEHRYQSGSFINDPITAKGLTTGNKGLDTQGSYDVNEIYGEISIPLVSNLPFAEDLEATFAARWFDYSSFGSDSTYKIGAKWKPISDLTLRGTYSTAFRAPTVGELFGGQADNFAPVKDPCRGPGLAGAAAGGADITPGTPLGDACIAQGVPATTTPGVNGGSRDPSTQLRSRVGGNDKLGPETAKIYTVGVVIEPRWVRNLSFTVDYYNMDIDKNIGVYGESVLLTGCYSGTNPEYCNLIIRNPSPALGGNARINFISNLNANVGKMVTGGIDFAARYALPTPSFGRFGLAVDATWLQKIDQTLADGRVVKGRNTFDLNTLNSFGGAGGSFPEWKYNAGVTWGLGGLGAGVSTRFLGGFHECGAPYTSGGVVAGGDFSGDGLCYQDSQFQRHVNSYHTEDVFVSYTLGSAVGKTNVMVGVQNVGDMPPTKIYNGFASSTDQYNYDQMGRFFYFRLAQTY